MAAPAYGADQSLLAASKGSPHGGDSTSMTNFPMQGIVLEYRDPVLGHIIYSQSKNEGICWLCSKDERHDALFKPCTCPVVSHRDCFRRWRAGWINPRNYFCCPTCMTRYNMERVPGRAPSLTKKDILMQYRMKVIQLWLGVLFMVAGLSAAIGLIAYGSDTSQKNIPVAVRYMLTSVIHGLPPANAAQEWRREFRLADTAVWYYYALLGCLVTAILVLVGFMFMGCSFDESERSSRGCCESMGCQDNTSTWLWCYCYDPCPYSSRRGGNCCGGGSSGGSCNCGDCNCCSGSSGGGGGCGGCSGGDLKGGGEVLLVLLLVIIVIILISAVFVIIGYAIRKWALFQDRMTDMLRQQQDELEGETVVLGLNEIVRPIDAV